MSIRFDVVIVGGGMVGAALACALGDSGLKIAVLDTRAPAFSPIPDYDLRVSAISLASRSFFENIGVWDGMQRQRVAPVEAMQVWEEAASPSFALPVPPAPATLARLCTAQVGTAQAGEGGEPSARPRDFVHSEIRFDAAEIGESCLAYIIENSVIHQALVERLHTFTAVQCMWPVKIESMSANAESARVVLSDGRHLDACLLVGADGAESSVRRAIGIGLRRFDIGQIGIVATVRTEKPHRRTALQRFLPTGPLAFLPLAEPHTSSIVWSADTARANVLMGCDDAVFTAELKTVLGDRLGSIVSVSPRQSFTLALAHAQVYTAPRAALVGDAGHCVHPLAGQGVNLGFMDVAVLAELLRETAAQRRDIGAHSTLRRYERARKGENLGMIAMTGGFKYLFGNSWIGLRSLRGLGLGLVNAVTPLKRAMMRRASGLTGDVPALARVPK